VIETADPDLFIFMGDTVYADTEDMDEMAAVYARLGAHPEFQSFRDAVPILAVWDDHDYGANDAGREYPRKAEAKAVFLDFFGEPEDSPRRARPGNYAVAWQGPPGQRTQILLLDTRWFRDPLHRTPLVLPGQGPYEPTPDETATLLGEAQWAWLEQQLQQPADLRLLVSSIQVHAEEHGWEKWANFAHERERLFALLRDTQAQAVIVLSGDRHRGETSRLDAGLGYPLYDITSSALNVPWIDGPPEPNRHRVSDLYGAPNFGFLTIDWTERGPAVTMELRHAETGVALWSEAVPAERLQALRAEDAMAQPEEDVSLTR
jgi:alkaline phosphatase D